MEHNISPRWVFWGHCGTGAGLALGRKGIAWTCCSGISAIFKIVYVGIWSLEHESSVSLVLRWLEGHAGELDRSKRETLEVFEPSLEAAPFHSRWVFLFCHDNCSSLDFDVDLWWNCTVTRWICDLFGGGGRGSSDRSPVLCPWPVLHTATAWRTWRQWKTTLWRSKIRACTIHVSQDFPWYARIVRKCRSCIFYTQLTVTPICRRHPVTTGLGMAQPDSMLSSWFSRT